MEPATTPIEAARVYMEAHDRLETSKTLLRQVEFEIELYEKGSQDPNFKGKTVGEVEEEAKSVRKRGHKVLAITAVATAVVAGASTVAFIAAASFDIAAAGVVLSAVTAATGGTRVSKYYDKADKANAELEHRQNDENEPLSKMDQKRALDRSVRENQNALALCKISLAEVAGVVPKDVTPDTAKAVIREQAAMAAPSPTVDRGEIGLG